MLFLCLFLLIVSLVGPYLWRYHLCLAGVWADTCCVVCLSMFQYFSFINVCIVIYIFLNIKKKKKKHLKVLGQIAVKIKHGGQLCNTYIHVVSGNGAPLLGRDLISCMGPYF